MALNRKSKKVSLTDSGEIVAAQSGISYGVTSLTMNAEADDLDVTVHFTGTSSATNVIEEMKMKDGGGLHADYGEHEIMGGTNQSIHATKNSGTGTFNVVVHYREV